MTDWLELVQSKYQSIPSSGLYHNQSREQFDNFCRFLYANSNDYVEQILELQKLKKTRQFDKLAEIKKQQGDRINKVGKEFEENVFERMSEIISDKLGIENISILRNHKLFEMDGDKKKEVGEIDAIIIDEHNNVVAVAEIKSSFDDIPDAVFQASKALNKLSQHNIIIEDRDKNKVTNITSRLDQDNILEKVFIFSKFDNDAPYFNFPGAFKHGLLNALVMYQNHKKMTKVKDKIFVAIKKKQEKGRYIRDVLDTLTLFENKDLLDHIQLVLQKN